MTKPEIKILKQALKIIRKAIPDPGYSYDALKEYLAKIIWREEN